MDFLISCLQNFQCEELGKGFNVIDNNLIDFNLVKDIPEAKYVFSDLNYASFIGREGLLRLDKNHMGFSVSEVTESDQRRRYNKLNNFFVSNQIFSSALWFVKDNAVTPSMATLSSDDHTDIGLLRKNIIYSNSSSENEITFFSKEELRQSLVWLEILAGFLQHKETKGMDTPVNYDNLSNVLSFNIPSFERAFLYLESARSSDFLPAKIASYIAILESIFSVRSENTHTTSERVAFFIGKNGDERANIYNQVHSAYDIRSLYVHGSHISDKKGKLLSETSGNIDNIVRRVLSKIFLEYKNLNYTGNQGDKINKVFNEMVLRGGILL